MPPLHAFPFLCSRRLASLVCLAAGLWLAMPQSAEAHKVSAAQVFARLDTVKASYTIEMTIDVTPTGDPAIDDEVTAEDAAKSFATETLNLFFDDTEVLPEVQMETITQPGGTNPGEFQPFNPDIKKLLVTMTGNVPEGAEHFTIHTSPEAEFAVVYVTEKDGKIARRMQVLYPGEFSSPLSLETVIQGEPPFAEPGTKPDSAASPPPAAPANEPGGAAGPESNAPAAAEPMADPAPEPEKPSTTLANSLPPNWFTAGFNRFFQGNGIHALFVLGLFFLSRSFRVLAPQITAYVLAFSLAQAVGRFGLATSLSPKTLMVLMVAGALYVAAENLFTHKLHWWRVALVSVFGLAHGLSFASHALLQASTGYPAIEMVLYELGLLIGSLAVLLAAVIVVTPFWNRDWYRPAFARPASILILLAALWVGYGTLAG